MKNCLNHPYYTQTNIQPARRQEYIDIITSQSESKTVEAAVATVLKHLIERCLKDDPNNRPSTEEVKETLDATKALHLFSEEWLKYNQAARTNILRANKILNYNVTVSWNYIRCYVRVFDREVFK